MASDSTAVGIIGCGAISGAYLSHAKDLPDIDIVACADMNPDAARQRAEEFGVPRVCSVDELLADDEVEIVLNLTPPKAHVPIGLQAIAAGKHHYTEKPLGINRDEGRQLYEAAQAAGLRLGCAPDTVLGSGVQTARKAIDDGLIGRPVAFTSIWLSRGHESWHPSPAFYYEVGGGPMFDMGPYYLTALLNLLGAVDRYTGLAQVAIPDRVITSQPLHGRRIPVETPDHVNGLIAFQNGATGVILTSFATMFARYDSSAPVVIYGDEGTLAVPDPNGFDGTVRVHRAGDDDWQELPPATPTGLGRAIGLADMAQAIRSGRPHRCSAEQAFCVLDLMQGFLDASDERSVRTPELPYERPAPMPAALRGNRFGEG